MYRPGTERRYLLAGRRHVTMVEFYHRRSELDLLRWCRLYLAATHIHAPRNANDPSHPEG